MCGMAEGYSASLILFESHRLEIARNCCPVIRKRVHVAPPVMLKDEYEVCGVTCGGPRMG